MSHNTITFCRALLLAGAASVLTVGPARADAPGFHNGGFHNGGFHNGGLHNGGFHSGGFHSGFHGFRSDGFQSGFQNVPQNRSFRGLEYSQSALGYRPPFSYFGSIYPPYYYGAGSSYPSDRLPDPDRRDPDRRKPPRSKHAHVTVYVPADAELWFDDVKKKATGPVREFVTPELKPDHHYTYEVRARWRENGREVTQTRKAVVTAGANAEVDFGSPPPTPKPR